MSKKLSTVLFVTVLATMSVWAQSPAKMSYQAVIRNASNALVTNHAVGMQVSILQGSASGTSVYVETQKPVTNANGLISIEIGGGSVVSGSFAAIQWTNGPYFVKTETDPAGGTNYTITGTSQLLSVPYALHAKTAESISGGITETDPVFVASPANGISGTDISNWNNKLDSEVDGSITNEIQVLSISNDTIYLSNGGFVKLPADDGSETKVTAGTNVTVTGSGTIASPYVVNATDTPPLAIGDSYGGGIIFWLDATGQHGLIAATADQSTGIKWYNGSFTTTGATLDAIYAGKANTNIIIANQGAGSYAAQVCADYSVTVNNEYYDDWYLPSKYELNLLYQQKDAVGGFSVADYWSSTEYNYLSAWVQTFFNGSQYYDGYKHGTARHVRAIRAF